LPDYGSTGSPVGEGAGEGDLTTNYIKANFSFPGEELRPINTYAYACNYVGLIPNYGGKRVKNYSCSVNMWYFDDPWVDWKITVQIKTAQTLVWSPVNDTQTFETTPLGEIFISPNMINWTITLGETDKESENLVKVENFGNVDITESAGSLTHVTINASKLKGQEFLEQTIGASNFTADEPTSTPCARPAFVEDGWENLHLFVDHDVSTKTVAASNNLRFCLNQLPAGTSAQGFNSTRMWELKWNSDW